MKRVVLDVVGNIVVVDVVSCGYSGKLKDILECQPIVRSIGDSPIPGEIAALREESTTARAEVERLMRENAALRERLGRLTEPS